MLDQNHEMTGHRPHAAVRRQSSPAGRPQAATPAGINPREGTGGGQSGLADPCHFTGAPSHTNTETGGDACADQANSGARGCAIYPAPDPHPHSATGGETTAISSSPALAMEPPPSSRKSPKGARSANAWPLATAIHGTPSATDDQGQTGIAVESQVGSALIDGEGGLQKRAGDGLANAAALPSPLDASPLVSEIVETWRRRQAFVEARRKLILQGKALCRRMSGGDKAAGSALYAAAEAGTDADAAVIVGAMLAAQEPLSREIAALDRHMVKLARRLPVADWAAAQKGYGIPGLAKTVGELGDLSAYHKGVAGIWKRAGLAVIDGGRQRKVAGDAALLHGYAPGRRSTFWNIAAAMLKGQGTGDASGPWRLVYDARKAHEAGRVETPMHAHNRALRYMTKRLLRDLWREWRASA